MHLPHSYLLSHGIHALTLKPVMDPKQKQMSERERIQQTLGLLEHLVRVND